ncbi:MAG TPA: hypothetical protein VK789_09775 [Bryobacteraceae bacterium]|nr:hypothetical protein [Bryobacteraceae bacterium]
MKMTRWQWLLLGAIGFGALALRVLDHSRIFLWVDETGFFNEDVYGSHPKGLVDYAWGLKQDPTTTNTWAWPGLMWLSCRLFGGTIGAARIPFIMIGAAAVPMTFWLIYSLIPAACGRRRFVASAIGAILASITIEQIDFSQRVFPYAATPFSTCAVLLAHMKVLRINEAAGTDRAELLRAVALYIVAGIWALCTHPSMALLLGVSTIFLAGSAAANFQQLSRDERVLRIWLAVATAAAFGAAVLLNTKNPDSGRHDYLASYYHSLSIRGFGKLLFHVYDLATYHLNLFYDPSLYWPERLNLVLLPLALLCFAGWAASAFGRFGEHAKRFALLSSAMIAAPAILSLNRFRLFPFGGVRQTLFLSPLLFVFCALGLGWLLSFRQLRIAGLILGAAYLSLWGIKLPRFYSDRLRPYEPEDIVRVWRENGELPFYSTHGNMELTYAVRDYPEIRFMKTKYLAFPDPTTSYFLIETRAPLGDPDWLPGLAEHYQRAGQHVELLTSRPAKHPHNPPSYFGSTYFPPSGLWIYKISPDSSIPGPGALTIRTP